MLELAMLHTYHAVCTLVVSQEKEELERQRLEERHLREQIRINNEKLEYETEIHKAMLAAKREKVIKTIGRACSLTDDA